MDDDAQQDYSVAIHVLPAVSFALVLSRTASNPVRHFFTHSQHIAVKLSNQRNGWTSLKEHPDQTMGRQSTYSPKVAEEICERISTGEPLRQICRDEGMPHWTTIYAWMEAHGDFKLRIARARELGEDAIAQDCLAIADDGRNDTYTDDNGYKRTDHDVIARSKLRIETRLKLLAKWNPRRWGEKVAIGGADDLPPIKQLSDDDLKARIAALQTKANG